MRLADVDREHSLKNVSLYLTRDEADWIRRELEHLLKDPEANRHFHVPSLDGSGREISCSIITESKIANLSAYSKFEQRILGEK